MADGEAPGGAALWGRGEGRVAAPTMAPTAPYNPLMSTGGPRPGQDPKTGRFIKGNKLGPGRPWGIPRAVLTLTYRSALEHACSPQDVLEITRRAVTDAKRGDHHARMYIAKIMGLDTLRLTIDPGAPGPYPAYRLDALDDEELALLGRLSDRMLSGPEE